MITSEDVIGQCSDLMLHGAYVEAIEAMEYAQGLGVLVNEDDITRMYELKVNINYELI